VLAAEQKFHAAREKYEQAVPLAPAWPELRHALEDLGK
jgi:hypothetical protein